MHACGREWMFIFGGVLMVLSPHTVDSNRIGPCNFYQSSRPAIKILVHCGPLFTCDVGHVIRNVTRQCHSCIPV